jgi:hypothetical protein
MRKQAGHREGLGQCIPLTIHRGGVATNQADLSDRVTDSVNRAGQVEKRASGDRQVSQDAARAEVGYRANPDSRQRVPVHFGVSNAGGACNLHLVYVTIRVDNETGGRDWARGIRCGWGALAGPRPTRCGSWGLWVWVLGGCTGVVASPAAIVGRSRSGCGSGGRDGGDRGL